MFDGSSREVAFSRHAGPFPTEPAFSPDGNAVAYKHAGDYSIYVQDLP